MSKGRGHRVMAWRGRVAATLIIGLAGCAHDSGGSLTLTSRTQTNMVVMGGFQSSLYSIDDRGRVTVLLFDGPVEQPAQAVTIRVFWKPRAGRTPVDPTATNATIHYTIFTGDRNQEVGVYSGAGFVYPIGKLGQSVLNAEVWQASLRLTDRSALFADLLGSATLEGYFTAKRDDPAVRRLLRQIHTMVTQRVGYPRYVSNPATGPWVGAVASRQGLGNEHVDPRAGQGDDDD